MACDAARQQKAVWNLGVSSYSPIIYWRKVKAAAEKIGRKPSEVYVFLDLSDIDDEANVYREGADGKVYFKSKPEPSRENWDVDPGQWLVRSTRSCWRSGAGRGSRSPAPISTSSSGSVANGNAG